MTQHVVVIGAGMVGHRLVEDLVRLDAEVRVTLIGAEEYEPYNRILLSEVLAGRCDLKALGLPMPDADRVDFRRGVEATCIDRENGLVVLGDGSEVPFDKLVLATGARAFVPPIPGLQDQPPRHVHVLRSIDDCRDVTARTVNAKHAVVLGGGVLGIEAAAGLRRRGVPVTVVDLDQTVMATQLDAGTGTVLAQRLGDLGVDVRTGTSICEVVDAYGELVAVRLADDTVLAADLLLVSCGIRAETRLAAQAGLEVDRGIVVDAECGTSDPRIFAIGDCAQPPTGMTGLLAPGWRQAEQVARLLAGFDGSPLSIVDAETEDGIRLKAAGVDLITLGVRGSKARPTDRVVTIDDPGGRRYLELVVRGDHLAGVTCLGAPDVAAQVSVVYERRTPLPTDPLALLLPERRTEKASPLAMPGSTTVCRCNTVTKRDIVSAWEDGCHSVDEVAATTRATTGCGGCKDVVCGLVDWLNSSDPDTPGPESSQAAETSTPRAVARA